MADAPRLLHARSEHGYTTNPSRALTAEPEAVTADAQLAITARVHRRERDAQLEEWEQRRTAMQRQLDWLYSQRFQRDMRSQLRALQRQIDRLDQQLKSA